MKKYQLLNNLLNTLRQHRLDSNGLYLASNKGEHYKRAWIRDCFYEALPELNRNKDYYKQTYQTLLDYFIKIEKEFGKFTWLINEPNNLAGYKFPHPRFNVDLTEINEEWGWKQLDTFGEFLYGLWLGEKNGIKIIRDGQDREIIYKIIHMLEKIEYWKVPDNAIWEENCEIHASSLGACLSGLTAIKLLGFKVNQELLDNAHYELNKLLPRESVTKDVDLALLTLIYPFNIVTVATAKQIIANVESELLRERGVLRYKGDRYYNNGKEAEWCFGLTFLALAYNTLENKDKAKYYLNLAIERTVINDCEVPELFYGGTNIPNDNTPLGWSNSMLIQAIDNI